MSQNLRPDWRALMALPPSKKQKTTTTHAVCKVRGAGHGGGVWLRNSAFGVTASGKQKKGCKACLFAIKRKPYKVREQARAAKLLREKSDAAFDAHVAKTGGALELRLSSLQLEAQALKLVNEVLPFISDGQSFNIATSYVSRCMPSDMTLNSEGFYSCKIGNNEPWMGLTAARGEGDGSSMLVSFADGSPVLASQLRKKQWRIVQLDYTCTRPSNMNAVEKRVHQLLHDNPGKLWRVDGAGAVRVEEGKTHVYAIALVFGTLPASNGIAALRAGPPDIVSAV
jgi:hypothetical protein